MSEDTEQRLRAIIEALCSDKMDSAFDEGIVEYRKKAASAMESVGWLSPMQAIEREKRIRELEEENTRLVEANTAKCGECYSLPDGDCIGHGCMHSKHPIGGA